MTFLFLGNKFQQKLPDLPNNLIKLCLGNNYDKMLPNLPNKLTYLNLGKKYNKILPKREVIKPIDIYLNINNIYEILGNLSQEELKVYNIYNISGNTKIKII